MKFDPTKPFGQVWGHPLVAFVQGGYDFDVTGKEVVDVAEVVAEPIPKDSAVEDFVFKILAGGPILQTAVYREAEKAGLDWAETIKVAAKLGVTNTKIKGEAMWSLK